MINRARERARECDWKILIFQLIKSELANADAKSRIFNQLYRAREYPSARSAERKVLIFNGFSKGNQREAPSENVLFGVLFHKKFGARECECKIQNV